MNQPTKIDIVANELRDHQVVRIGFQHPPEPLDVPVVIQTTRPDQARWLISQAARDIAMEDRLFLIARRVESLFQTKGVATHRRQGYVLGHWRDAGVDRCDCDIE